MDVDAIRKSIYGMKTDNRYEKLCPVFPDLIKKMQQGTKAGALVEMLNNDHNLDISLNTFYCYLYRYRKANKLK